MHRRLMADPEAMRAMAGRFDVHAQKVGDEARRMRASSSKISGAGGAGLAEQTSYDTMGKMQTAFCNIVLMLHGVRDGMVRDALKYEYQEAVSQRSLSS